jgi:antitoxin VapB
MLETDLDAWFAELDRFADIAFMEDGRRQPPMPEAADAFGDYLLDT